MKWMSIQPLIGGMTLGAELAIGNPPTCIISQGPPNDLHLLNYYESKKLKIPYLVTNSSYTEFKNEDDLTKFNKLNKNIELVVGVPVCSGLSMCNSSNKGSTKARGADAIQNNNMYDMCKLVLEKIKPKVYVFENAPALYTLSGKPVADKLFEIAQSFGYSMSLVKTSTIKHGIPQDRHRTFAFFWNSEFAPIVNYYDREYKVLSEYLSTIPNNVKHSTDFMRNSLYEEPTHIYAIHKFGNDYKQHMIDKKAKTIWQLILTENLLDDYINFYETADLSKYKLIKPDKALHFANHIKTKLSMGMGYWDGSIHYTGDDHVNAVIGKNMWKTIHPIEERFLSIRELLYLMGHPHDFELLDPLKNINHIAQNVPVNTARDWVSEGVKFIKKELKFSTLSFLKQNNEKQTIDTVNKIDKNMLGEFF